jgi:ribonuclease D
MGVVTGSARFAFAADLPALREAIAAAPRLAIDTEFHAERRYRPQLYLVQIHLDGGGSWLIDPLDRGTLEGLAEPLLSRPWILHGGSHDLELLRDVLGGLPERVLDTQIAYGLVDPGFPRPLGTLVASCLGVVLPKGETLSDWSRRPLSSEQLRYAIEDVELLIPLWEAIAAQLRDRGRLDLAELACREQRDHHAADGAHEAPWRELFGVPNLTPQQACVLAELAEWREMVAREDDQPPRAVLGDALMLDLARRQPLTVGAMAIDRRIARPLIKRLGAVIVERIAAAASRPEWAWPAIVARHSAAARRVQWIELFAEVEGHSQAWSPRLVLPRRLTEALASSPPATREALGVQLGPWRDRLCGDRLWQGLSGDISLRMDPSDVLA